MDQRLQGPKAHVNQKQYDEKTNHSG
jgi:hypothetical protein